MKRDNSNSADIWLVILDLANTARTFVEGISLAKFKADLRTNYAAVYCLELVADACSELSSKAQSLHPDVPWCDLIEEGDFDRRHYDRVSLDNVWRSLHEKLPILVAAAEAELGSSPDR